MRPLLVTARLLERMKACRVSLVKFRELWPEGCLVTVANIRQIRRQYLNPDWFCLSFIRKAPKAKRWYKERLDAAWHLRCVAVNRSWARTYNITRDTSSERIAARAQRVHDRKMWMANHMYDATHDWVIVVAINKAREERK